MVKSRVRRLRLVIEITVPIENYDLGVLDEATLMGVQEALQQDIDGLVRVLSGEVIQ